MKSKGLLALILVVGLVLMAGSAKAADSMADNVPGNGAFAYFYVIPNCISTTVMIFNTSDADQWIHIIAKDECSNHVWDADLKLTHKGTAVVRIEGDDTGAYIVGVGGEAKDTIGRERLHMSPDENGNYMGYLTIVAIVDDTQIGVPVDTNPLIVSTALTHADWWVGVNAAMIQGLVDADVDDLTGDITAAFLAGRDCVTLYGRWYDDDTTRGNLVLVFPVGCDNEDCFPQGCDEGKCEYSIAGYSYDEEQHKRSFTRTIKEANMIPFGTVLPTVGATAGWVEVDNTTASAFGFTIMEDGLHSDALPLFKQGGPEAPSGCPTCILPE